MNRDRFPPRSLQDLIDWLDHVIGIFAFFEFALLAVFVLIAVLAPRAGTRAYGWIESRFAGLAHHPVRQILAVGVLAILARAAVLPWLGAPVPLIHDELSIFLQAQTYLAGRLANPVHPFWEHFETFMVNQLPAYASMYFPGRGVPLAAGLLVADNAWAGVWLSFVLLAMSAVWMLQGWVSLPMALLGGVLVVLRFGVFSYWINSYWGGAFTATGAMLVIGAVPRILRQPRWRHGVLIGLGAAILMTNRPYEGMLLCLPVALLLCARLLRPRWTSAWTAGRVSFLKVALPAALLVGAGGASLLAYNLATTGNLLKTPYTLNRETYAIAPAFLTSPPVVSQQRGPSYFRKFYTTEAIEYERRRSVVQTVRSILGKLFYSWSFYVGATFAIAFFIGVWASRKDYFLLGTLAFFFTGYAFITWTFPHYAAPIYPVLLILILRGFEWLRRQDTVSKPAALFLSRAMPTAAVLLLALPMTSLLTGVPSLQNNSHSKACCAIADQTHRTVLIRQLLASPGPDLVLVKDSPDSPIHFEMVYNEADIDASEIVWARRVSPEKDARLQNHFSGRRLWEYEWRPGMTPDHAMRLLE